ncbi:MAG TPA: hypothetical protein VNK73_08620 [Actinomycetota bacterium]|nr:hypothetical protein [Actinomycetota bacterium]
MPSSFPTSPVAGAAPRTGTSGPGRAAGLATTARMSWRADLVTVVVSAWLIGGLFVDGWAHVTRPQLETFFTPWHAVFYSGFAASALWIGWSVWSRRRPGVAWRAAVPVGYGPAVAGLVLFAVSGLGDLAWHLAFGIEQDVAALLSPSHLGLFMGGLLVVTAPLRSVWADPSRGRHTGLGPLLPALLSAAVAGSGTGFFFMYLHPAFENDASIAQARFLGRFFAQSQRGYVQDQGIALGVAGFIIATVLLLGPVLYLLRRWDLPAGSVLLVAGPQFVLIQALTGFVDPGLAVLGLAGTLAVELLLRWLRPSATSPTRLRIFSATAPVALWGVWFAGIALHDGGLGWEPEVVGAVLVWPGLTLLALAVLMLPSPVPGEQAEPARDQAAG